MAKYAVVRIKGHQYKVSEGQEILVDKISEKEEIKPEVLLVVGEKGTPDTKNFGVGVKVGKPVVKDAKIKVKVLKEVEKGEKIDILKYKSKSRYRRHYGFRPQYTRLLIEKITV